MPLRAFKSASSKLYAGLPLYPHRHEDGTYVASRTRFEVDYIRVEMLDQLEALVGLGYSARMSNPEIPQAPSLISAKSIESTTATTGAVSIRAALLKAIASSELDAESMRKIRLEQSLLRAFLLGGKSTGSCILCGECIPENLLVAAHLKARSKCSPDEKRDIANVAALMCKIGCDDLYEKAYVFVENGEVRPNEQRNSTPAVTRAVGRIKGNHVSNWASSAKYFDWHRTMVAK